MNTFRSWDKFAKSIGVESLCARFILSETRTMTQSQDFYHVLADCRRTMNSKRNSVIIFWLILMIRNWICWFHVFKTVGFLGNIFSFNFTMANNWNSKSCFAQSTGYLPVEGQNSSFRQVFTNSFFISSWINQFESLRWILFLE